VSALISGTYHIRNFTIIKPADAPQSGSGLDNGSTSYEAFKPIHGGFCIRNPVPHLKNIHGG